MKVEWQEIGKSLRFEAQTDDEMSLVGHLVFRKFEGVRVLRKPCAPEYTRTEQFNRSDCLAYHRADGSVELTYGFELDLARVEFNAGVLLTPAQRLRADAAARIGHGLLDGFELLLGEHDAGVDASC